GRVQTADFNFTETIPARLQLRARLEDVGPQLNERDLVAVADVRAISEKIRVLFIAGETFPEVEFIRSAIMRDKSLVASTWLQTADPNYDQPGNPPIRALPMNLAELDEYDCVVLYDPDPALWPPDFAQVLTDFVSQSGGGLVYVAGERNTKDLFDHPDDPSSQWLSLLPVVVEPGLYHTDVSVRLSAREAWKLDITPEGRSDPVFSFYDKSENNAAVIANLPGMFWHFPVTRAKPGATVLARHADIRMRNEYGQHVLLATQLVGPGRTFFVGFDSTYRWRYLDDQYFAGFWARMIDRAGRNKRLGGRYPYTLSVDRSTYRPGSQVTLTARFNTAVDRDRAIEAMHGEVEAAGSSNPQSITLSPRTGDPNSFDTTFTVDKSGLYTVRVWTGEPDSQGNVRAATL
ncbi:MAG TPA: VWA domain-containing protein, partial [Chloroflexota bacterium]|nr:VWA domain-containing protein [Chloroflexota bacterium]